MRLAKTFAIVSIFLAFKFSLHPPSPIYFIVGTSLQYTSTYKGKSFSSWLLHDLVYYGVYVNVVTFLMTPLMNKLTNSVIPTFG
jgi:hypothetical protein